MTAQTSAGTTLAIAAGRPATFNQAGFAAKTFTTIGEVTTLDGDIGRVYTLVTHLPLATRGTRKMKGSFNSGSMTVPVAIDRDDAGQVIAQAAVPEDDDYSFCITERDGTKLYFCGMVMSFPVTYGGTDTVKSGTISIEITCDDEGYDFVQV